MRPQQSYIKFYRVSFLRVTLHHIAIPHTLFRVLYLVIQAIPPSAYLLLGLLFVLSFKCLNNPFPTICMQKELWYERSHYICLMLASAVCVYTCVNVLFPSVTEAEEEEQDWSFGPQLHFLIAMTIIDRQSARPLPQHVTVITILTPRRISNATLALWHPKSQALVLSAWIICEAWKTFQWSISDWVEILSLTLQFPCGFDEQS